MQAGNASCSYLYYTIVFQLCQDFVIMTAIRTSTHEAHRIACTTTFGGGDSKKAETSTCGGVRCGHWQLLGKAGSVQ